MERSREYCARSRWDALSSQCHCRRLQAVLLAAAAFQSSSRCHHRRGHIAPAKALVIGAGVAGLQAIATARRLGAVVEAFDTRPVVKEQVQSLGAKFLEVDLGETGEGAGGYAKELSEEAHRKEVELLAKAVKENDIIITTAAIPGRPAPKLITADMVRSMKPGSVIVDLAAETGGNTELTCRKVIDVTAFASLHHNIRRHALPREPEYSAHQSCSAYDPK